MFGDNLFLKIEREWRNWKLQNDPPKPLVCKAKSIRHNIYAANEDRNHKILIKPNLKINRNSQPIRILEKIRKFYVSYPIANFLQTTNPPIFIWKMASVAAASAASAW